MAQNNAKNSGNGLSPLNIVLMCIAGALMLLMIVLVIILFKDYGKSNGSSNPTQATSSSNTEEVTSESETQTEIQTTEPVTWESLPEQSFGEWDLSEQDTTNTPYGNDLNNRDDFGIPNGVIWYTNKWATKYNVDFISFVGVNVHKKWSNEKTLYLTFDCVKDSEETEQILDILKEKNVKATFFVTSTFYDARPDLIQRMLEEGHRIGSNTIHHKNITTMTVEEQTKEIMDVVNKLKNDFNYDCRLFRFPENSFSDQSLALVENLGLKSVFWSYAYNDYAETQPDVEESYNNLVKYLHPGAIYDLRAGSSTNREILANWIDEARNEGYEFGGVYPVN